MTTKVTEASEVPEGTKSQSDEAYPKDTKWEELGFAWLEREMFSDSRGRGLGAHIGQSVSSCGVLELGSILVGRFDKLVVQSLEKLPREQRRWNSWDYDYYLKPKYTRYATEEEVSKAFETMMADQSKSYGLGTVYLRESQHRGDFRKLLEKNGWKYLGRFWNPKTRHPLHHWTKVFHEKARTRARKKKSNLLQTETADAPVSSQG